MAKPEPKKNKKEPDFDRKAEIDALTATINKQFEKDGAVMNGDEFSNIFIIRRPTGIVTLDVALGGGLPAGGLTEVIGSDGSSKTYLANRIIAGVQATYGEDSAISLCMTEMHYDKAFAKYKCGVRIAYSDYEIALGNAARAQQGLPPYTAEEVTWLKDTVGRIQEGVFATGEQLLEVAVRQVESNLFQIVLIDSFGALLTEAEKEATNGIEDKHYGGASGPITQFMHRLHAALNLKDRRGNMNMTTVIGINQYRENVGKGLFGPDMRISGGRALKHGKLVSLHVEGSSKIKVGQEGRQQITVGKEIRWELLKGKAGCHDGPKGRYEFYFGEHGYPFGANIFDDILVAGVEAEIIEQAGAWLSYNNERLGQGKGNAAMTLFNNPQLFMEIRNKIFEKHKLSFITREPVV